MATFYATLKNFFNFNAFRHVKLLLSPLLFFPRHRGLYPYGFLTILIIIYRRSKFIKHILMNPLIFFDEIFWCGRWGLSGSYIFCRILHVDRLYLSYRIFLSVGSLPSSWTFCINPAVSLCHWQSWPVLPLLASCQPFPSQKIDAFRWLFEKAGLN